MASSKPLPGGAAPTRDVSHWSNSFEGEWATNVDLSRPHVSFGDPWGNVLIVDQRSHSVLRVTPEGRLFTYAGTHTGGDNGDSDYATNLHLNSPNGGWMRADGTSLHPRHGQRQSPSRGHQRLHDHALHDTAAGRRPGVLDQHAMNRWPTSARAIQSPTLSTDGLPPAASPLFVRTSATWATSLETRTPGFFISATAT